MTAGEGAEPEAGPKKKRARSESTGPAPAAAAAADGAADAPASKKVRLVTLDHLTHPGA
jgi:hypothetical protein